MAVLALAAFVRSRILIAKSNSAQVPPLVAAALERLATQATLHTRGEIAEAWISVGQLRDDILRDEFDNRRRDVLWNRVGAVIERNANVRASVREGRGGDVSRVWEWIGSVGLTEEPFSARRSGGVKRVSFGGLYDEEQSALNDTSPGKDEGRGRPITEQRTWNEGRPIY